MTHNASKSIYTWTVKHLEFTLKYGLGKVCEELWQWLQSLPRVFGNKIEFEFKEFIEYTAKFRLKPRTFYHAKAQFEKLVFLRIINIDKDLGHNTYRIELRHPDDIKPKIRQEKNLHYHEVSLEKSASNDDNSETRFSSSSNSNSIDSSSDSTDVQVGDKCDKTIQAENPVDEKERKRQLQIIKLCARYGILFNPKKQTTHELYKYPIEEIGEALELYKHRNKRAEIENPPGWLVSALRNRFFEDSYYCVDSFVADMKEVFFNIAKSSE